MVRDLVNFGFAPGDGSLLPTLGFSIATGPPPVVERAIIVIVEDAMVEVLEGATLSLPFAVSRGYVFIRDIKPVGIEVSVFPSLLSVVAFDLTPRHAWDWQVAVWVRKRTADPDEIDDLMLLMQQIIDLFVTKPLAGTKARCIGVEARPGYDPEKLDTSGVFNAGIVFTFRTTK